MAKKPITTEIKVASFASLLRESHKGCVLLAIGVFDKLEDIKNCAKTNAPGYKTIKKLLTDKDYDK